MSCNEACILVLFGLLRTPRLMDLGILLFLGCVVSALITLPVEFNASSGAVRVLRGEVRVYR